MVVQRRLFLRFNDSGGILDRHSGPMLDTCSGQTLKSGQLRTGINGQLPPEWVANFPPESVSKLLRLCCAQHNRSYAESKVMR